MLPLKASTIPFDCQGNFRPSTVFPVQTWPTQHDFVSFGDSYSAGIGASCGWVKDAYDPTSEDCLKCEGAYPYQLLLAGKELNGSKLFHVGCTGAVINDITTTSSKNRTSQISLLGKDIANVGWATISIGGNDVGFGKVAINCLFWASASCQVDIQNSQDDMDSAEFQTSLAMVYKSIIYEAIQQGKDDFLLVVTGYSHFFNANDALPCDKQYLFRGNYLSQALRSQINTLVVNLNAVIEDVVGGVNRELTNEMLAARVVFFDIDYCYEGHRFCEPDKDWLTGSWFLTIYGTDILADGTVVANDKPSATPIDLPSYAITCDPNDPDLGNRFMCDYALYLAGGGAPIDNVSTAVYGPEIMKALHPKTAGHQMVAIGLLDMLRELGVNRDA